jgi:hypothetical protein
MVRGKEYVRVGHMMFPADENFKTQTFEEGLYLLRNTGEARKWIAEEGISTEDTYQRQRVVREFVANAVRFEVITMFDTAEYHGD